jgi:hypothetical protein
MTPRWSWSVELRDLVVSAAEFEAADGLRGLVLEIDFGEAVEDFCGDAEGAEARRVEAHERCANGGGCYAGVGGEDVVEGDEGHCFDCIGR